jgi:alpha-tubulin suppressor-like RCC1 family protein
MSLPTAAKTLLMAGPALSLTAVLVAGSATTALAQARPATGGSGAWGTSGTVIEHWGVFGADGQLADLHVSPVSMTLPAPVSQIGSSNSTQYALLTNGQVWAWGEGGNGQLGNGTKENSFAQPVQVAFPAGVTIAYIPTDADPYNSAFAVDTTGHVWAWGDNEGGEFCLGNQAQHVKPVELQFSDVTEVAGASNHASYDAGGTLYSCGVNTQGELGNGTTTSSMTPVQVSGLSGAQVTTLVASAGDTGALLSNGAYYDWGDNNYGEVGNGTTTSVLVPYQVQLPSPVTQLVAGGSGSVGGQSLALLSNGSLWAWGDNTYFQLSNHLKIDEETPAELNPPGGVTFTAVAAGGATSYGISPTGAVWAWGSDSDGEVGNGHRTRTSLPVKVATGATQISATARDVVIATTSSSTG